MVVLDELDAERLAHLVDCAREPHAATARAGMHDRQAVLLGKRCDLGDVFVRGAVVGRELFVGKVAPSLVRQRDGRLRANLCRNWRPSTQPHRYLDVLVRMHRAQPPRALNGQTMASLKGHTLLLHCHDQTPVDDSGVSLHTAIGSAN